MLPQRTPNARLEQRPDNSLVVKDTVPIEVARRSLLDAAMLVREGADFAPVDVELDGPGVRLRLELEPGQAELGARALEWIAHGIESGRIAPRTIALTQACGCGERLDVNDANDPREERAVHG